MLVLDVLADSFIAPRSRRAALPALGLPLILARRDLLASPAAVELKASA